MPWTSTCYCRLLWESRDLNESYTILQATQFYRFTIIIHSYTLSPSLPASAHTSSPATSSFLQVDTQSSPLLHSRCLWKPSQSASAMPHNLSYNLNTQTKPNQASCSLKTLHHSPHLHLTLIRSVPFQAMQIPNLQCKLKISFHNILHSHSSPGSDWHAKPAQEI